MQFKSVGSVGAIQRTDEQGNTVGRIGEAEGFPTEHTFAT